MKQHITVKQLYEADDAKLSKLINDEVFSINSRDLNSIYCNDRCGPVTYETMAKIVTIGKMIEILSENYIVGWLVDGYPDVYLRDKKTLELKECTSEPKELCDSLWEAIKEVIK